MRGRTICIIRLSNAEIISRHNGDEASLAWDHSNDVATREDGIDLLKKKTSEQKPTIAEGSSLR